MRWRLGAGSFPLQVAALAFFAGGLGNVAFSLHDGSQSALALTRFVLGALFAGAFLAQRGSLRVGSPPSRPCSRPWLWLAVAAGFEAAAIALLMASADLVSASVFTTVGLCSPAVVALLTLWVPVQRPGFAAAAVATLALCAAAGAVWSSRDAGGFTSAVGVALAVGSTLCASVSVVASSVSMRVFHPATMVGFTCVLGIPVAVVWAFTSGEFVLAWSTFAAALFVAAIPGGLAKAAWLWANARAAPQLVQSMSAVSVVSAGLCGWLLLGQVPSVAQLLFSALAVALVTVLALLRAPAYRSL